MRGKVILVLARCLAIWAESQRILGVNKVCKDTVVCGSRMCIKHGNAKNSKPYFREWRVFQCGSVQEVTWQMWMKGWRALLGDAVVIAKGLHWDLLDVPFKVLISMSSHCKTQKTSGQRLTLLDVRPEYFKLNTEAKEIFRKETSL